jgi:hypothetical protein
MIFEHYTIRRRMSKLRAFWSSNWTGTGEWCWNYRRVNHDWPYFLLIWNRLNVPNLSTFYCIHEVVQYWRSTTKFLAWGIDHERILFGCHVSSEIDGTIWFSEQWHYDDFYCWSWHFEFQINKSEYMLEIWEVTDRLLKVAFW